MTGPQMLAKIQEIVSESCDTPIIWDGEEMSLTELGIAELYIIANRVLDLCKNEALLLWPRQ